MSGVWAVLVAAGRGDRLGGSRPKAFAALGGRPLLAESMLRLDGSAQIGGLVAVVPAGWEEPSILLAEELGASKLASVIVGGATRADSVRLGVAEVPGDAGTILVHDAARPLVPEAVIERVLAALAEGFDGAVPGLPVTDTIKRAPGGVVVETPDRAELYAVQTPQGFDAAVLRAALAAPDTRATDCASLVEAAGGRVRVVEGDPRLVKVTSPEDLALVEAMLRDHGG